ncbi:MAG: hypothetical protein EHM80_14065, partial [Nitrospiraceae bacterium]
ILTQLVGLLRARPDECFFWATHAGAELDLLIVSDSRRLGFEIKRTDAPTVTASMKSALETLGLQKLSIIHAGRQTFQIERKIRAVAAFDLLREIKPIRV